MILIASTPTSHPYDAYDDNSGTTGRTNVKPQTFKTAANAALSLGWWQMLMGKRCQPLAQLGPTAWGDLYLHSLYVVLGVKLQIDFLQKVDSIHTHLHTIPPSSELYLMCYGSVWLGLISLLTELVKIAVDTKRHVAGSRIVWFLWVVWCMFCTHVGGSRMHRASPEHPRRAAWRMTVSSQGPGGLVIGSV